LGDKVIERGGKLVGAWPKDGYEFAGSSAERNGQLMGLGIDINTQSELTGGRIKTWTQMIKEQFGLGAPGRP
jgi:flavodoxin I